MLNRRDFLRNTLSASLLPLMLPGMEMPAAGPKDFPYPAALNTRFCRSLKPVGRILELEGWYVWCNSPIFAPDGMVHLFFSRWPEKFGMGGWISRCEIAHAVAQRPEGPYEVQGTVLAPRPGSFDATTCHNPHIQFIDGRYCLFYMGNSNGKTNTKRIGLAVSDSLWGPWERSDTPLLEAGQPGEWDDHCTTNPAFIKTPDEKYLLYYKSWNSAEYENAPAGSAIRGNRKYGLAIADQVTGPYHKYEGNPVIDFSSRGKNEQLEDAFLWFQSGKFNLLARDMGFYDHAAGLLLESKNGLQWSNPKIAWLGAEHYLEQPPAPSHLKRYGRFERPQLLMKNGKPAWLFTTTQGGKYQTASGFVFKVG